MLCWEDGWRRAWGPREPEGAQGPGGDCVEGAERSPEPAAAARRERPERVVD